MERSEEYRFESELPARELVERIAVVAEQWDGEWQPEEGAEPGSGKQGRLGLPVTAGLRRGWMAGELTVDEKAGGSELLFTVDRGELKADKGSVFVLLMGAFGGLVTLVAPFLPSLWPLVPIGLLLGFSAWFMVVARLRSAGPEEFFAQVESE